jgi:hypothetical protein
MSKGKGQQKPSAPRVKKPAAPSLVEAPVVVDEGPSVVTCLEQARQMPAADRENPAKIGGEALRALAHQHGLPLSELERMDDSQVRVQMQHTIYRRLDQRHEVA